jgi:hypothetical protein
MTQLTLDDSAALTQNLSMDNPLVTIVEFSAFAKKGGQAFNGR